MKSGDRYVLLIVTALAVIALGIYFLNGNKAEEKCVIIKSDGNIVKKLPLTPKTNMKLLIKSKEGHLTMEIKNGKVRVITSTCKEKLCVKEGWIDKVGESIICLPNRISITITGNNGGKIDTTTY